MLRLIIILSLLLTVVDYTNACSCRGDHTVEQNVKYSDAVFTGKVLKRYLTRNYDSLNIEPTRRSERKEYDISISINILEVQKVFKGNEFVSDTVVVYTPVNGAACGVYFVVGEKYTVYAQQVSKMAYTFWIPKEVEGTENETTFWTHLCTRTGDWYEEEEQEILKILNN